MVPLLLDMNILRFHSHVRLHSLADPPGQKNSRDVFHLHCMFGGRVGRMYKKGAVWLCAVFAGKEA